MYIPKLNYVEDRGQALAFMKRFSFATIVTTIDQIPTATHLPFVIEEEDGNVILTSHFAKANRHWQAIRHNLNLVIFTEPHAYISPQHYEKVQNVPTWNYLSIHAYGKAEIIHDKSEVYRVLESMIGTYEQEYQSQWDGLPSTYKDAMSNGIVAFRIMVDDLQYKQKLSQNKKQQEQRSIIESLENSPESVERNIAEYMKINQESSKKK